MQSMFATSSSLESSHRLSPNSAILEMPQYISISAEVFHDLASNEPSSIPSHGTILGHSNMAMSSTPSSLRQIFQDTSLNEDQGITAASHEVMTMAEVEEIECEFCGMEEECTQAYVAEIRASYSGRWICGICAEAVKEDQRKKAREKPGEDNMEEILENQMKLHKEFTKPDQVSYTGSPVAHITASFISVLKRNPAPRSAPGSPTRQTPFNRIDRTQSCISSFLNQI